MRLVLTFLCFNLFLAADTSFAAGIIYRVEMMKAMRQHQGMSQQQNQQQQEYQEQQQGDHSQPAPSQPTYEETVAERNKAIAQAIIDANAHNQVTVNEATDNVSSSTQPQTVQPAEPEALPQPNAPQGNPADVKDVVDLSQVWKKLDKKSTVWKLLIDDQAKVLTVSEYINRFQNEGVKINEPPTHYVEMIDQISSGNPQMLDMPFGQLIQILAIVDYDFDNGMDKDTLARNVLGEAGYESNKKRFTQQAQPQQEQEQQQ